jgi:hypothetical protein
MALTSSVRPIRPLRGRAEDNQPIPVTPEERASVLAQAAGLAGGTVARVGDLLSMPGDYARGALAGKPGERVTGRELLREYGVAGPEDNWGNFFLGLAAEVPTDPLNLLFGPKTALTEAGQALGKLGWADDVASAATRRAIRNNTASAALPISARRARRALEKTGRTITESDPAVIGRPFYGYRRAMRDMTLEDIIDNAGDADAVAAARQKALDILGPAELTRLGNQTLSRTAGIGLPWKDPAVTGDIFGKGVGDAYADAVDMLGSSVRWNPVGRYAAAAFDQRVDRAVDPEEQITNLANFRARKAAGAEAVAGHAEQVSRLLAAQQARQAASSVPITDDIFSDAGNRALGQIIETGGTPADQAWAAANPGAAAYASEWLTQEAPDILARSREAGLASSPLTDQYGIGYLPRQADDVLGMASKQNDAMSRGMSALTGDQLGRTDAMSIPGGRDTIMRLSKDPRYVGTTRLLNEDAAVQSLMAELKPLIKPGQPDLDEANVRNLARVLQQLPLDRTQRNPLFGQHPVEMIGKYKEGRAQAMATAGTMLDSLATFAVNQSSGAVPGGRHISLPEAVRRLGLRSVDEQATANAVTGAMEYTGEGAAQQLRNRLAPILGFTKADQVNLAALSIPEDHVTRLMRAQEAFTMEAPAGELLRMLDHYTQLWRGAILAWPARATRDLYSGAVSNWLSDAFDMEAVTAARGLIVNGTADQSFQAYLNDIPRYAGANGLHQFQGDLAAQKLIGGPQAFESGASLEGDRALAVLAGEGPNRTSIPSAMAELAPKQGRLWTQFANDFGTYKSAYKPFNETLNPVLRAGERLNTYTDGINRISGYLALIRKGYAPDAAAAVVKRSQVDYSSLSALERNVLRAVFPWYSYTSRIFKEVLRQLAERPGGRYAQMLKATERAQEGSDQGVEGDDYVPSAMRAQFAAALPDVLGGRPAPGTRRYLTDLDFPGFDQINMIATPGTPSGAVTGTARQVAMQMHPGLRLAAEVAFGTDLFTNRPLGDATSTLDAITGMQVPTAIDKAVELVPFAGRPLYFGRSLLDTKGGATFGSRAAKTAVNTLTGVKFRDVTPDYAMADAAKLLEGSIDPYTRDFSQTFIPEEMASYVPQWAHRRLAVMRQLQKDRKALKDQPSALNRGRSA